MPSANRTWCTRNVIKSSSHPLSSIGFRWWCVRIEHEIPLCFCVCVASFFLYLLYLSHYFIVIFFILVLFFLNCSIVLFFIFACFFLILQQKTRPHGFPFWSWHVIASWRTTLSSHVATSWYSITSWHVIVSWHASMSWHVAASCHAMSPCHDISSHDGTAVCRCMSSHHAMS